MCVVLYRFEGRVIPIKQVIERQKKSLMNLGMRKIAEPGNNRLKWLREEVNQVKIEKILAGLETIKEKRYMYI